MKSVFWGVAVRLSYI